MGQCVYPLEQQEALKRGWCKVCKQESCKVEKSFNVVMNYMGQERWIEVGASTAEEAELKFKKAFPQYRVKAVHES